MTTQIEQSSTSVGNSKSWNWDDTISRIRIVSGLILFVYLSVHLTNHVLGLISHETMVGMARWVKSFWRLWPASILLYGALAAHVLLSLWRVYTRRSLKMQAREWMQLAFGIAIPLFLITHVMGTKYASAIYGINDTYAYVLLSTFVFSPINGYLNAAGLIVAWLHGCVGIHMWLQTKPWYRAKIRSPLLVVAALLPTLSLAGYLSAGRRIAPKAQDGEFMEAYYQQLNLSSDAVWDLLARDTEWVRWGFVALLLFIIFGRMVRTFVLSKSNRMTINYVDGPVVKQSIGATLLEVSQLSGVPHASVCGGRGRCSTCRVRILSATPAIPPPTDAERRVLSRVRAEDDVRLACQLYPKGKLQIVRLLPSDATMSNASRLEPWSSGREKTVTVMFVDIREFTKTAESRLPFDVVYLINQFSQSMGKAVENHGGRIDKFLGDGFMALFGVNDSPRVGATNALQAAHEMIDELKALNDRLAGDLSEPMRIGIGVHTGSVILGDMGYGTARGLTAIGDTVNTASRLEAATKEQKCVLCVSVDTVEIASKAGPQDQRKKITVRGKKQKFDIYALNDTELLEDTAELQTT